MTNAEKREIWQALEVHAVHCVDKKTGTKTVERYLDGFSGKEVEDMERNLLLQVSKGRLLRDLLGYMNPLEKGRLLATINDLYKEWGLLRS